MTFRILSIASILTIALTVPALAESKLIPTGTAAKPAAAKPAKPKQDADGDGRISMQEHLDWQKLYFQKVDANADGFLTKEEKASYSNARKEAASAKADQQDEKKGFFKKFLSN